MAIVICVLYKIEVILSQKKVTIILFNPPGFNVVFDLVKIYINSSLRWSFSGHGADVFTLHFKDS